jgi:hypothetical protein
VTDENWGLFSAIAAESTELKETALFLSLISMGSLADVLFSKQSYMRFLAHPPMHEKATDH